MCVKHLRVSEARINKHLGTHEHHRHAASCAPPAASAYPAASARPRSGRPGATADSRCRRATDTRSSVCGTNKHGHRLSDRPVFCFAAASGH